MASGRYPGATENYNTPQKSERIPPGSDPTYIVLHHAATTNFESVVKMELGGKQVSSTLVIKDHRAASMFDERYRAWSLSSATWDSKSCSVETCNESTNGWTISEASYRTLALVVAYWSQKYNIPLDRDHVIGHREVYTRFGASYATACPGGMDLDRVVRDAIAVRNGTANMALSNDDLKAILLASFDNTQLGSGKIRNVAQALSAIYFYGDVLNGQNVALKAQVEALHAKVDKLASAKPAPAAPAAPVDPKAIADAVSAALAGKAFPTADEIADKLAARLVS